jgi:hypothetical protein
LGVMQEESVARRREHQFLSRLIERIMEKVLL